MPDITLKVGDTYRIAFSKHSMGVSFVGVSWVEITSIKPCSKEEYLVSYHKTKGAISWPKWLKISSIEVTTASNFISRLERAQFIDAPSIDELTVIT